MTARRSTSMRGYGRTGKPLDIDQYTLLDLVGDMVGVVSFLESKEAAIVGSRASVR
ncbi:pimeloyl-ACP methyl ester carboxylesterase [Bradyrhizobium sp. JR6.1]